MTDVHYLRRDVEQNPTDYLAHYRLGLELSFAHGRGFPGDDAEMILRRAVIKQGKR